MRSDRARGLLEESDPRFLSGLEAEEAVELWDAVALALGEYDPDASSLPTQKH